MKAQDRFTDRYRWYAGAAMLWAELRQYLTDAGQTLDIEGRLSDDPEPWREPAELERLAREAAGWLCTYADQIGGHADFLREQGHGE